MTQSTSQNEIQTGPYLSVVVPVYNSSADLRQCLAGLASSSYRDFDVLVVDDGSTETIEPIVKQHEYTYMRIDGPSGPARARNLGVAEVHGKYVVFIDADVVVHQDTLSRFAEVFSGDDSIDAAIGTYDDAPADPGFISQYKNIFHHYVHQAAHGDVGTFWSGCGAMRRDLFLRFGGFDEVRYRRPAIEDIELGTWLSAAGHRIVLDSRVKCKHLKRWTFKNLLKTDIFDRAIPWTRLMMRVGAIDNALNVKVSQRISVVLALMALLLLPVALWNAWGFLALGLNVAILTLINSDFYAYYLRKQGLWFTLRVVPMHWLYFWYCGFGAFVGAIQYHLNGDKHCSPPLVERASS